MTTRLRILVVGDDSSKRLRLNSGQHADETSELSDSNPLEITIVQAAGVSFEYFELTNDRRCRPYLQLYLDLLGQVDLVLYLCVPGQSEKDMKEWLRLMPLAPLKLLFVSQQPSYNNQTKLIDKLNGCFRKDAIDSIVFLPRLEKTLEEHILSICRNEREVLTLEDYIRETDPISMMRWLFRKKKAALLPASESPV